MIFNIYTFVNSCKICTFFLFRCLLSNSIFFWWISVIYFNFYATLSCFFMWNILKAIWKSMYWHLSISFNSKVLFSLYKTFIENIKHLVAYDHYNSSAQLFDTSITLLQLIISLYYLFSSIQRHPSVFNLFEFFEHPKKLVLVNILGNFPVKHSFWSPLYICRPSWCAKGHLPWKFHIHFRGAKE